MPAWVAAEETHDYLAAAQPDLARFTALLHNLAAPTPIADVVVVGDYPTAAYRFSLLPLLGEPIDDPGLATFAELALNVHWDMSGPVDTSMEIVNRNEVAAISAGLIVPIIPVRRENG